MAGYGRTRRSALVTTLTFALLSVPLATAGTADPLAAPGDQIFVSSTTGGQVDGLHFADEDILGYDPDTDTWSLFLDGSDIGLGPADIDGFEIAALDPVAVVHLSLQQTHTVPGLGTVEPADVITFTGTPGPDTAGTLAYHLDGSDVRLTMAGENINAVARGAEDGDLALSVAGTARVGGGVRAADEDLLNFAPLTTGADTSGTFSLLFDGSDVDLADGDVMGATVETDEGRIHLALRNGVAGPGLAVKGNDIVRFTGTTGDDTTGALELYFDGDAHRFTGEQIDGLHVLLAPAAPTADLHLEANDDTTEAIVAGDSVTFTVTVTNDGPKAASAVVVTPTLPGGLTDVSTSGCATDPAGLPCPLGDLASGADVSFTITGTVAPGIFDPITSSFAVASATVDPEPGNDTVEVETPVTVAPADPALLALLGHDGDKIFLSSTTKGNVDGIAFDDEDILVHNGATDTWALFLDGSDLGLDNADINGFDIVSTGPLAVVHLTFAAPQVIPGVGLVDNGDAVTFTGTPGLDTAGVLSFHLDGSDVGLSAAGEDLDALTTNDTDIVVSTVDIGSGLPGGVYARRNDLIGLAATSIGEDTAGTFSMFFDASDLKIGNRNLVGAATDDYGRFHAAFQNGLNKGDLLVDRDDVVTFTGTTGDDTDGTLSLLFDGDLHRFGNEQIDGLDVRLAPPNRLPEPIDDDLSVDEDTVLTGAAPVDGLLANDTDPDGDPLSVVSHDGLSSLGAVVTVESDGSFSYDPTAAAGLQALDDGDVANDSFVYLVDDGRGGTASATVNVTVTGVTDNVAPMIGGVTSVEVPEGTIEVADLDATDDRDAEGAGLTFSVTGGADGDLFDVDPATGELRFITAADDDRSYEVEVTVTDSGDLTDSITLTVTVTDDDNDDDGSDGSDDNDHDDNTSPVADPDGAMTFADRILSVSGSGIHGFGTWGNDVGQFDFPKGVAVDPQGTIVVADTNNHRIQICDPTGAGCTSFGEFGQAPGQFSYPKDVAITSNGDIVIADTLNHRIQICDPTGATCTTFGASGDGPGQFSYPRSVAITAEGKIVIADTANHRIQICDPTGVECAVIGTPGQFDQPTGVAVTPTGDIVIADANHHRIQICDPTGASCSTFGSYGHGSGQFDYPHDVAVAPDGAIIIADVENHRIQSCSPTGTECTILGSFGHDPGRFDRPYGIAVDSDGHIVIADSNNHRIQVAAPAALMINDHDPDGDPITVVNHDATSTLGAMVSVDPDGSYTYDPTGVQAFAELGLGEKMVDTFTYTISDGRGGEATTTVSVTVVGRLRWWPAAT